MIQGLFREKQRATVSNETEPSVLSELYLKLDMTPLATLLQEAADAQGAIADAADQESEAHRRALETAGEKLDMVTQQLAGLEKFIAVFQQSLQHLEAGQRRLGEQTIRQVYLKPVSKRLLGLWRSVGQFVSDQFAVNALTDEMTVILSDFDIELIAPEPGDPFDARTMRPKRVVEKKGLYAPMVTRLDLPGARHGEFVLEHALVQIGDGLGQERDAGKVSQEAIPQQQTTAVEA